MKQAAKRGWVISWLMQKAAEIQNNTHSSALLCMIKQLSINEATMLKWFVDEQTSDKIW